MLTSLITPTLEQLAAAQQSTRIMAFEMGSAEREVARLQAVYTAKRAELEAFECLFAETVPDIVLRGHAGQKLVLRLPFEVANMKIALRDSLERALGELEAKIIETRLYIQELAQGGKSSDTDALRPALLALCQPTPPQAAAQLVELPPMEVANAQTGSLTTAA
jgi:hypothetical protein